MYFVEPEPGATLPDDLKIKIGVQPVTGRLPETFYEAEHVKSRGPVQYNAQAQFDRQELWRVRLVIESSQGNGEATAQVEVTPPGFGRWDLLLYLLPFSVCGVVVVSRHLAHEAPQERASALTGAARQIAAQVTGPENRSN
jgi:hypothetical protein